MALPRNRLPKGRLQLIGAKWHARWKYRGVLKSRSLGTSDRREAEKKLKTLVASIISSIQKGTYATEFGGSAESLLRATVDGDVRLSEVWGCYVDSAYRTNPGAATQEQYEYQFGRFLEWMSKRHPGITTLRGVTSKVASDFMNGLSRKRTANTYKKYRDLLSRIHRVVCKTLELTMANPFEDIPPMDNDSERREEFTPEQKETILGRATGEMQTLFYLGFYSGQRLKDCCLLDWKDVLMDAGAAVINPYKTRRYGNKQLALPMHPDLKGRLAQAWEQAGKPATGYVLPEMAGHYLRNRDCVTDRIQAFLKSLGIEVHGGTSPSGRAIVRYGFHSCRHSFVSWCRDRGVPDAVMEAIVGRSYRHYTHVGAAAVAEAINGLPCRDHKQEACGAPPTASSLSSVNDEALLAELRRRNLLPET